MGTQVNPYNQYAGPGLQQIGSAAENLGTYYHPTKGKGIVLGKYKLSENVKNEITDYDVTEITTDYDSEMYKDALELAKQTGLGYSELNFNQLFPDMAYAVNYEDIPNISQMQEIEVPDTPEVYTDIPNLFEDNDLLDMPDIDGLFSNHLELQQSESLPNTDLQTKIEKIASFDVSQEVIPQDYQLLPDHESQDWNENLVD